MLKLLLILYFSTYLFAYESLLNLNQNIKITKPLSYMKKDLKLDEALSKCKNNQFIPLPKNAINSSFNHNSLWLCLGIENKTEENIYLSLTDISVGNVNFYKFYNNKLTKIEKSYTKTNNTPFLSLSSLVSKIELAKSEEQMIYLIEIHSAVPFIVELLIGNENDITNIQLPEIVIFCIFIGVFLSLFIYNIFLYFSTKQKDYIFYSIFTLFLVCWLISFHGYFSSYFQLRYDISNSLKTFFLVGNLLFLVLFSIQFLNIKHIFFKTLIPLSFILFFLVLKLDNMGQCLSIFSQLSVSLLLIILGKKSYKQNNNLSKYYFISLYGYFLGSLFSFLMFNGIISTNFYTLQAQLFGSIWSIIFLSLALGDKISLLQKERNEAILTSKIQEKMLFLQSRQASIGQLVGNITHQWREPLGAIGAIQTNLHATLFFKGELTQDKVLKSIDDSTSIIRHLSDTIDVFYRLFKHKENESDDFNLLEEIKNIDKIVHYSLKIENISLEYEIDKEINLFADKNEFINAILNIILNAKDILVERKIINPYIHIQAIQIKNSENIQIIIRDNAGGIVEKPLTKIFESSMSSKENGIGIGLFITKKIIEERMAGKIDVENDIDGAKFTILLPSSFAATDINDISKISYNTEESTLDRLNRLEKEVSKQDELKKALNQWENIFNQTHWGVALHKGMSNKFEMVNPAFCKMYGYNQYEILSMSKEDFFTLESLEILKENIKKAINKSFISFETIHTKKDGSEFPVRIDLSVIKNENKEVLYHITNIHDISEQKKSQERLLLKKFAINHINESIFLIDKNSKFYYVNEGASISLGYTEEELLNMHVSDIDTDLKMDFWITHWEHIKNKKTTLIIRKHKRKDGSFFPVEVSANYFEYNGTEYNLAIARNITERIEAQKRKEDEKMRIFFERQLVGMAITSPTKGWLHVNDKLCKMLGYTGKELKRMTWAEVTHPDDLGGDIKEFERLLKGEINHYFYEKRYIKKDKSFVYANLSIGCVRKENKEVDYLIVLIEDITERKFQEKALKDSEQLIRTVIDATPDWIFIKDKEYRYKLVNKGYADALHMIPEDFIGKNDLELGFPEEFVKGNPQKGIRGFWADDNLVLTTNKKQVFADDPATIDGIVHTFHTIKLPMRDEIGEVWGILAFSRDITERKEMEKALQISEQKFRTLIENATDNIVRYDTQACITYINPQLEKVLGVSCETVVGKTPIEIRNDSAYEQYEVELKKVIATGKDTHVYLTLPDSGSGEQHHYIQIVAEQDIAGHVIGAIAFGRDVTELTNKTIELQKALEFNEGIIVAIPDLMFDIAPDGTYINIWAQNTELLIAQKEILLGKNFKEVLPADAVVTALKTLKEVDEKGFSVGNTYSLDFPDETKWFELSAAKQKSSGNYIVLSRDITERKELEILLEKEHKFLIDAQRVSHTGSWYLDIKNDFLTWSDETYRIFELDKENIDDLHKTFYEYVHPDDREIVNAPYVESLKTGVPYEVEHRIVMNDGRIKYVIEKCEHIYNNKGEALYSMGTVQDITERKKMEKKLEDSYNFLNNLIDSIHDPIFVKDRKHNWILLNNALCKLTGFTREEFLGKSDYDVFPKEEADIFWKQDEIVFNTKEININEEKFTSMDGVTHYIETIKSMFMIDNKEYLVGTVRDITERNAIQEKIKELNTTLEKKVIKRTEELAKKEREFRTLAENLPDFLARYDKNYTRLYVNKAVTDYFKIPIEELIGTNLEKNPLLGVPDSFKKKISYVFKTAKKTDVEVSNMLSGTKRWWNVIFTPEFDQYGKVINVLSIAHDITEIKKAEIILKEREEKFSKLFKLSPAAVSVTSLDRNIYLDVNDSFLYYTKYKKEEVIGKNSLELELFEDVNEKAKFLEKVLNDGYIRGFEFKYKAKDGTTGHGLAYASVITLNGEKCLLSHTYDINAQKELQVLQQKRLDLEERLSKIVSTVPGVNYIFEKSKDDKFKFLYLSPKFEELFGISNKIALKEFSKVLDIIPPNYQDIIYEDIKESSKSLKACQLEFQITHSKKGTIWIEKRSIPEKQPDGTIKWYGFFHDITERKKNQEHLQLIDKALDSVSEAIYIIDYKDLSIIYVNIGACNMLGYTKEELISMKIPDIDCLLSVNEIFEVKEDIKRNKYVFVKSKHKKKNGEIIDVEISGNAFVFNNIDIEIAVVKDISEINKTHLALKKSEEAFNAIVENSPDTIIRYDLKGNRIYLNPIAKKLMNKPNKEILGQKASKYSPLLDYQKFDKIFNQVKIEKKEIKYESAFKFPDGSIGWGEQRLVPEFNSKGEMETILLIGRDLSHIKNKTN